MVYEKEFHVALSTLCPLQGARMWSEVVSTILKSPLLCASWICFKIRFRLCVFEKNPTNLCVFETLMTESKIGVIDNPKG